MLEPALANAARNGNYDLACDLVLKIQNLIRPTGHTYRLNLAKIRLFESAIKAKKFSIAESGLIGIIKLSSESSRLHLEASILLAICYLKQGSMDGASIYIEKAFYSARNIKSKALQSDFRIAIVERFEEEALLINLAKKPMEKTLSPEDIQDSAGKIVSSFHEHEIFVHLGSVLTPEEKRFVLRVNAESIKQLTSQEKKLLPAPENMPSEEEWGRRVFRSLKRSTWNAVCDPESETYRMWYQKGVSTFFGKPYLSGAIVTSLAGYQIGNYALITYFTALSMRLGLDVFCETTKPKDIMDYRKKRG